MDAAFVYWVLAIVEAPSTVFYGGLLISILEPSCTA